MRCLRRNKIPIYYATYQGKTALQDSAGNYTGDYSETYSTPAVLNVNVSIAIGEASVDEFGTNDEYTKVIVLDDPNFPMTENTVFWIDRTPTQGNYDYRVKRIAKSLNSLRVWLEKCENM